MTTELGKAFVQIVPSAKGIKGSITSVLNDESLDAGKKSGDSFGKNLVSKVKGVIAAAGIGALLKATIEEGAKLEQSYLGGLDTLYGTAADKMRSCADQAAKAGISANSFAEQAVSFGAALKSSFKGAEDAESKAAEAANVAILDMADNSAKMGTSIESIQNAYQGFAKQNYTMLDNLKIGYGGTKTEMQRLLKDAQKLSGVKYDINNLADVYSAIHVIQEELGIAGVAAEEAETTLLGSLGAMQASFSNFLGNLTLGKDIGPALTDLVQTSSNFLFKNLIPAVINIIKALPGAIYKTAVSFYPIMKKNVTELIDTFVKYLKNEFPKILVKGMEMLQKLIDGIVKKIPSLISALRDIISNILSYITKNLPSILSKGAEILQNLITGIVSRLPSLISTLGNVVVSAITYLGQNLPRFMEKGFEIVSNIARGIANNLPAILQKGFEVISNIVKGIYSNMPQILSSAASVMANIVQAIVSNLPLILAKGVEITGKIASGIISAVPDLFSRVCKKFSSIDWGSIGSNIISGIIKGIKKGVGSIADAAKDAAKSAYEAAKNFLGIKSPSKKFEYLGRMNDEGMAVGIKNGAGAISSAMKKASGLVNANTSLAPFTANANKAKATLSKSNGGFQQTINIQSPKALNPSEVARQTRNSTKKLALRMSVLGG